MIGREAGDGPHSLCIRSQGHEGPKKFEWMVNLLDVLCGTEWRRLHARPIIMLGPSNKVGSKAKLEAVVNNQITTRKCSPNQRKTNKLLLICALH